MIGSIGTAYLQIATLATGAASETYCCNDPACDCRGGREAKQALEARQAQAAHDAVSVSDTGRALLASELGNAAPLAASAAPLRADAVPPPVAAERPDALPPRAPPSPTDASLAATPGQSPALAAYRAIADDGRPPTEDATPPARIDTYA